MQIKEVTNREDALIERLLTVWESAVRATHLFLSDEEIRNIGSMCRRRSGRFLFWWSRSRRTELRQASLGLRNRMLEMLFVSAEKRGQGIGGQLLRFGMEHDGVSRLAVNEQNPLAQGFYAHMGFEVYKRTEFDEQGNPVPFVIYETKGRRSAVSACWAEKRLDKQERRGYNNRSFHV